jgi:hypothetical protein
MEGCRI